MRSIYEFSAYKKYMSVRLQSEGARGQLSRAAEALNCQPSFLSRVMNAEIQLTPEHGFMLTRFWRLDVDESDYFQTLVEHERASGPQYKEFLASKIAKIKKSHESLQKRVQKEPFAIAHQEAIYFSSWHWSVLHFLVTIPAYQTVKSLAHRLGLSEMVTLSYLKQLEQNGLVRESKGRWEYAGGQFHVPKDSPFVAFHHQNWRARAVLDSQNPANESVHYTSVLTLSREDLSRLKELMLRFISDSDVIARPSQPEECAVLTCDLFTP